MAMTEQCEHGNNVPNTSFHIHLTLVKGRVTYDLKMITLTRSLH